MIAFKNSQKQSIELVTVNYQFPDFEYKEFDDNWLQINIKITEDNKEWQRTDPFLLACDWLAISEWFENLSKFVTPKWTELGFIEPNIEFQIVNLDKAKDWIEYCIQLKLECIPDFHKGKNVIKYQFGNHSKECKMLSELCRMEYNLFPERK